MISFYPGWRFSPKFCMWMCLPDSENSPLKNTIFGPFNIPFSVEKHPIYAKLGAFLAKSPKIHPILQIGRIG